MKRHYTSHTRAEHYPQNTCSHAVAVSMFHFVPLELTPSRKHSLHTAYQNSECHSQHLLSAVAVSTLHCCPTRTEGAPFHQLTSTRKHSLCTTHQSSQCPTTCAVAVSTQSLAHWGRTGGHTVCDWRQSA